MRSDPAILFRPLARWPREETIPRQQSQFRSDWSSTIRLLREELSHLEAETATIHLDIDMSDVRADGSLRGQVTAHSPRVMLLCDSKFGPLSYPCDAFYTWRDNVRAIALGLGDLRRVDRYGLTTSRGEQYTGFKQLGAGGAPPMTVDDAAALLEQYTRIPAEEVLREIGYARFAYKHAVAVAHPDKPGGSDEVFKRIQQARELLEVHHGDKL